METRYEGEPGGMGRPAGRRRPAAMIAIVLVVAATLLAKPWEARNTSGPAVVPTPEPGVAVAPPAPRRLPPRPPAPPGPPAATPTCPSERDPSLLASRTAKEAEGALAA